MRSRSIFDIGVKVQKLNEVEQSLLSQDVWQDHEKMAALNQQKLNLSSVITQFQDALSGIEDALELVSIYTDQDPEWSELQVSGKALEDAVVAMEFKRMFASEFDESNAYFDIQAGSGGTEAQDWANMLYRMYQMWFDRRGFKVEVLDVMPGEVAGIKNVSLKVSGPQAFGWLRTETGVHRLVRKSPFDSGNRRHTSFASVFASPEVDDDIDIAINPQDLRIDTYRASGAGGQHVNTTDSAVRITHEPTGIVVQCQQDRSQHKNKDKAMKQLKAKLYQFELDKKNEEKKAIEGTKNDISWGNQIRSYVLDQSRIKDLRTGFERTDTQSVLNGDLDDFVAASLKAGVGLPKQDD